MKTQFIACTLILVFAALLSACAVQPAPNSVEASAPVAALPTARVVVATPAPDAQTLRRKPTPTVPMPTPEPPTATSTNTSGIPAFKHIFIIVMENKEYDQLIDNASAPYMNDLAQHYGVAAQFYGVRHPSLPNYFALTGGDTFGVTTDCESCTISAPSIVDQLQTAGKTWKAYMETMPRPCFVGSASPYAMKHNPFIYYDDIRNNPARCSNIVPFTEFATDVQNNTVPEYVWITPNLCSDSHDCPIYQGDAWLKTWVPQILATPAWQDNGALFITYDEGNSNAGCCNIATGGQIPTLVISPLVQPGFRSTVAYTHYSLLRTIEDAWGLPPLGHAAEAEPMRDFFAAR